MAAPSGSSIPGRLSPSRPGGRSGPSPGKRDFGPGLGRCRSTMSPLAKNDGISDRLAPFSFTDRQQRAKIALRTLEYAMSFGRELKRRAGIMTAPAIFLAITGYFGWNATQGDRGLVAYAQRQDLLQQVLADQAAAKAERDGWEIRVSGLRASHLDPDTLDERARAMLNLAGPERGDRQTQPPGQAVLAGLSGSSSPAAASSPAHAASRRPGSAAAAGSANKPPSTADRSQSRPPRPADQPRPSRPPPGT